MSDTQTQSIPLYGAKDFAGMRRAGRLAAATLDHITPHVQPGITTGALDTMCAEFIQAHGATSACLGYRGFPKSVCTSVNHVVCHGIPGDKPLRKGDILNIDVTVIVDGWHGDTSRMFYVGEPSVRARKLVETTYTALMRAIDAVKPGVQLGDIGHIIQEHAEGQGFSIVREFCGHGLGQTFHAPPEVLHFGPPGTGTVLEEGMFFTIEPMLNAGRRHTKVLSDGWTAVTRDRSLSAQFEHSLGVTADGVEIFTQSPAGYTCPPYTETAPAP